MTTRERSSHDGAGAVSRCRVTGTLRERLPLYYERGVACATIVVSDYTVHLRGRDAVLSQRLVIGRQVTITGVLRRTGRRTLMRQVDGELVEDTTLRPG